MIKFLTDRINNEIKDAEAEVIWSDNPLQIGLQSDCEKQTLIYRILGATEFAGLPGVIVRIKPENPETAWDWFCNKKYEHSIDLIMQQYLPLTIGWEVQYCILNGREWAVVQYATVGKIKLGKDRVFQENKIMEKDRTSVISLISLNKIIKTVEEICKITEEQRRQLEQKIQQILSSRFEDGQILTADDLNNILNQIEELKERIEKLEEKQPSVVKEKNPEIILKSTSGEEKK